MNDSPWMHRNGSLIVINVASSSAIRSDLQHVGRSRAWRKPGSPPIGILVFVTSVLIGNS